MTTLTLRVSSPEFFISRALNVGFAARKIAPDTVEFRSGVGLCGQLRFTDRHTQSVISITKDDGSFAADVAMRNLGRAFPQAGVA